MNWIPFTEGNPPPDAGEYWITATRPDGVNSVYSDILLDNDLRAWSYYNVRAYMLRDSEEQPEVYTC